MAKKLRLGLIGVGNVVERCHLPAFRTLPEVEIVALGEVDQKVADEKGARLNIPLCFGDHRRMLAEAKLDAVVVGTPNHLHCPHTLDALKAGCHVLVEKPIGLNVAEVKRMIAAGKRAGKIVMGALCFRFRNQVEAARKLADSGALGTIYHARAKYLRRRGVPGIGNWWTTKACGGGALGDIGVHVADAALWVAGLPMPTHASAVTYTKFGNRKDYASTGMWGTPVPGGPMDVEDYASGFIRFGKRMTMTVEISWAAEVRQEGKIEVLGDRGGVLIGDRDNDPDRLTLFTQRGDTLTTEVPVLRRTERFVEQAQHFVECIRKRKKPISDLTTTLPVTSLLEGMYKSARAGKEVAI